MSKGEESIEGYTLISEIGKREHTMLYRVAHQDSEAILAVFHKRFARSAQFLKSLERLSILYQQLSHPNMLKVHRWNITKEPIYILMEPYEKPFSFDSSIKKSKKRKYLNALSSIIDKAHKSQHYHGGLSPEMIFQRSDGSLCVGGWGRYYFTSYEPINSFLAPEDTMGTRASDLYAMALISYKIISGTLPWEEKCSPTEIEDRKRRQELRPLTAFGFSESLAGVLNKALSNYPVNRYDNAADMNEAIQNPPHSARKNIKDERPPRIDLGKNKISWRRDARIILPLIGFFFLFCLSFYYFTSTKPHEAENNVKMRFKGKEQSTDKNFEKSNRVEANGVFFDFIEVPSGEATLGSLKTDTQSRFDETPHQALFNESFLLSQTEITVAQWNAVMKIEGEANAFPKTSITWMESILFCNALSKKMGKPESYLIDGDTVSWKKGTRGYRLPTEAEWEYAAKGKNNFLYAGGDLSDGVSWSVINSKGKIQQVALKKANSFSLHDMSGNASEWIWDWYSCPVKGGSCADPYPSEVTSSSRGVPAGTHRVIRGGSVADGRSRLRISSRNIMIPTDTSPYVGFRIAY